MRSIFSLRQAVTKLLIQSIRPPFEFLFQSCARRIQMYRCSIKNRLVLKSLTWTEANSFSCCRCLARLTFLGSGLLVWWCPLSLHSSCINIIQIAAEWSNWKEVGHSMCRKGSCDKLYLNCFHGKLSLLSKFEILMMGQMGQSKGSQLMTCYVTSIVAKRNFGLW